LRPKKGRAALGPRPGRGKRKEKVKESYEKKGGKLNDWVPSGGDRKNKNEKEGGK